MTKNIAKHAFKSGLLPKPRRTVPRVNAKYEQEAQDSVAIGFSDPKMVPKGSVANPPPRVAKSASYKIEHSAKEPSKQSKDSKTPHQEWKSLSASVRRTYLRDSLAVEEKMELKRAEKRQSLHEQAKKIREQMDRVEDSEATKLTLPSIDQSLLMDGPMVQPRTEEETRILNLKRKANLATTRLEQVKQRDSALLTLYQNAHRYIITEQELNAAVDQAFSTDTRRAVSDTILKLTGRTSSAYPNSNAPSQLDRELISAATGTIPVNKGHNIWEFAPGLPEITDALDPELKQ